MPVRTIALLLILAVCLTYVNILPHDFIGDDHILLFQNSFYKHFSNLKKLFSRDYIITFSDIDRAASGAERNFSGGVSYRPVSAFSIFVSYFLWKENPLGYHLDSLLMHAISSLLVFYLILLMTGRKPWAVFAGFIFATHPINTELVNVMSYRSDFLSFIFFMLSLIGYVVFSRDRGIKRPGWLVFSYAAFFLALFSKENAATLPFIILAYDVLMREKKEAGKIRQRIGIYAGFFLILGFYLYVYVFVFPNANARIIYNLHQAWGIRLLVAVKILYSYLSVFVLPFKISVLPPLFAPKVSSLTIFELLSVIAFIVIGFRSILKASPKRKEVSFFLAWFFIAYFPTAGIIPIPNPFSFRFMYLPLVGLCFLAAFFLENLSQWMIRRWRMPSGRRILLLSCVAVNMAVTVPYNVNYLNDFTACREMIRVYPQASRPYWVLGLQYLGVNRPEKARKYLQKYLEVDVANPFVEVMGQNYFIHHMLGRTFLHDPDRAIAQWKIALKLRPDYIPPYIDLAWAYSQKKDYRQALGFALKSLSYRKNILAYIYAVYCYIKLKEFSQAKKLLAEALSFSPGDPYLLHYRALINKTEDSQDKKGMI